MRVFKLPLETLTIQASIFCIVFNIIIFQAPTEHFTELSKLNSLSSSKFQNMVRSGNSSSPLLVPTFLSEDFLVQQDTVTEKQTWGGG